MASAAIWLEEFGIPPLEVCLDWAWQIQTQFAKAGCSVDGPTTTLRWQRIEVGDSGELLFPSDLQKYSPDERLQELLSWAQGKLSSLDSAPVHSNTDRDVESELRKLTDKCISGFTDEITKLDSNSQVEFSKLEVPPIEAEQLETLPIGIATKPIRSRAKVVGSKTNVANQAIIVLKQNKIAASLASVLLIAGCYFALRSGSGTVEPSKSVETSRETTERHSDAATTNTSSELDGSESLAEMTEIPQLGVFEPAVPEVPQIALPNISTANISTANISTANISTANISTASTSSTANAEMERKALANAESSVTSAAKEANTEIDESRNEAGSTQGNGIQAKTVSELTDHDVMQELDALTKSAENKPVESDMEVSNASDLNPVSEALVLRTYPMIQTQKLAAKIKVRARQPVWQLHLSVDDEFELTPAEPQDISDRKMTTWLLSDSDAKSPKVRLVIQAQAGGRQTSLRWRIFANAEDLPDLMLPLDKDMLQPLQDRLRIYAQVSQREADRLRQIASGAERDVRAGLSKQRANLESQSKLASRLTTIVAEAQLLDDLLRSQLTLYAKLRDGVGPDAPTLLQFGDPSEIEKVQEESKPPVVAE